MTFIHYPKCSTCKAHLKSLKDKGFELTERDIVLDNPSALEIKSWHETKNCEIKKFINTSGLKYKELALKDKLSSMSLDEIYTLLSTDGMLIKRPLLIDGENIYIAREIASL